MILYPFNGIFPSKSFFPETDALAPIEAEILFVAGFATKRLKRIAGFSS
jgi:hypothetical protein